MARVVVVGGGFAGTAAAARLAKQGHEVTLLERADRLGGALGLVRRNGFSWDAGPASTALPAVVRDLFRKSGRPLERALDLVAVQPLREHRFPDGSSVRLPSGSRAAQLEAVETGLGSGLGRAWVDYVHGFAEPWDRLRRSALEHPYSPDHVERPTRALLRTRSSLARLAQRSLPDPRLRQLALGEALIDGQDPRRMPAWTGLWAYVELSFGRWSVPGGLGLLAEAMAARLAERRVRVLTGTTAHDLRTEHGRVVAVETDHGPLDAEVVVVAVDPATLPALSGSGSTWRPSRGTRPVPPPRMTHLGLRSAPELPAEVVLHGGPPLVLRTGGQAPTGGAAWTVLDRGRTEEDPVALLARAGIDVRDRVEVRVDRPAGVQASEPGGSAYGAAWAGRTTVERRLALPPVAGVYAAGVHVALDPGLAAVGLTAAVAAERIGVAPRARPRTERA